VLPAAPLTAEQTAAGAEESAAAAQELSAQARNVNAMVEALVRVAGRAEQRASAATRARERQGRDPFIDASDAGDGLVRASARAARLPDRYMPSGFTLAMICANRGLLFRG
jgi:hypothetical protein